jgi:hypothetical protein
LHARAAVQQTGSNLFSCSFVDLLVYEIPIAFLSARIRQLRRRGRRHRRGLIASKQKHCENSILKSKYLQKALKSLSYFRTPCTLLLQ